jgi:hypothetical protein
MIVHISNIYFISKNAVIGKIHEASENSVPVYTVSSNRISAALKPTSPVLIR